MIDLTTLGRTWLAARAEEHRAAEAHSQATERLKQISLDLRGALGEQSKGPAPGWEYPCVVVDGLVLWNDGHGIRSLAVAPTNAERKDDAR